jgi:hypothetical protein
VARKWKGLSRDGKETGGESQIEREEGHLQEACETRLMREEEAEEVNRAGESLALCPMG